MPSSATGEGPKSRLPSSVRGWSPALHREVMLPWPYRDRREWEARQLLGQGRRGPRPQPCPGFHGSAPPKDWFVRFYNFLGKGSPSPPPAAS